MAQTRSGGESEDPGSAVAQVVDRLLQLVRGALATVVPNLRVALAVGMKDCGVCGEGWRRYGEDPEAGGELLILDGVAGLVRRLEEAAVDGGGIAADVSFGAGGRVAAAAARQRVEAWLDPRGALGEYDLFVSYRWTEFDSRLALAVYSQVPRRKCPLIRLGPREETAISL
jgi:hypothetical protein